MRKKILLLGSSMTQRSFNLEHHGWGAALANWYCRTADVLNRGAGGYNSKWCKVYLSKLIGNEKPDMTILFIGNNDAIVEYERQHVSLADFKSNILSILESLYRVKSNMCILLVTTTKVNEELKLLHSNTRRSEYADVIRDIVKNQSTIPSIANHSLALVDLWPTTLCSNLNHEQQILYGVTADDMHDGAHLNKSGNKKVFEKIKYVINSQFPYLSPDTVKHKGNKRRAQQLALDQMHALKIRSNSTDFTVMINSSDKIRSVSRGIVEQRVMETDIDTASNYNSIVNEKQSVSMKHSLKTGNIATLSHTTSPRSFKKERKCVNLSDENRDVIAATQQSVPNASSIHTVDSVVEAMPSGLQVEVVDDVAMIQCTNIDNIRQSNRSSSDSNIPTITSLNAAQIETDYIKTHTTATTMTTSIQQETKEYCNDKLESCKVTTTLIRQDSCQLQLTVPLWHEIVE